MPNPLGNQGLIPIGPFEGLDHGGVEILNESQQLSLQVLHRCETGPLEELAGQDAKPQLNLVQPRRGGQACFLLSVEDQLLCYSITAWGKRLLFSAVLY